MSGAHGSLDEREIHELKVAKDSFIVKLGLVFEFAACIKGARHEPC